MSESNSTSPRLRLAAVGDLLLDTPPEGQPHVRNSQLIDRDVRDLLRNYDVVFGNLECTLAGDDRRVPTEPRVVASPALVRAVKSAGFHVVSLANNHMFDALERGFLTLRDLLNDIGLTHFGAGMNLDEAVAPAMVASQGLQLAFLGATDRRSGPFQFAGPDCWGVASLDMDRLTQQIRDLRERVDHVLVSVHWGEERFLIPSPTQIDQARALIDAGASMVLGHHPHVLQGLELWHNRPIIYSMGNFLADDVYFTNGDVMRWNATERAGCVLLAEFTRNTVENVRLLPTCDSQQLVALDHSGFGQRRLDRVARALARGVTSSRYRREHLWVKTILPTLRHLRWTELRHLRPRHVRNALRSLLRARSAE